MIQIYCKTAPVAPMVGFLFAGFEGVFAPVCICWITVCICIYPSQSSHFCNLCSWKWSSEQILHSLFCMGCDYFTVSEHHVCFLFTFHFFSCFLIFLFPCPLCDWLWCCGVWRELMTGVSGAEMSDQMLSQHDHHPYWWIMNTAHLNRDL